MEQVLEKNVGNLKETIGKLISKNYFKNNRKNATIEKLINKIKTNENLSLNLKKSTFNNINLENNKTSKDIIKILDIYIKHYDKSEIVTKNINSIIIKSFSIYQSEDPLLFAKKEMSLLNNKEKSFDGDLVNKIKERLELISSGSMNNLSLNDLDNINNSISQVRKIRNYLKNLGYKNINRTYDILNETAYDVISVLENLKTQRNSLGYGLVSFEDISDYEENEELYSLIK